MQTTHEEMSHSPISHTLFLFLIEGFNKLLRLIMTIKVKYYFYPFGWVLNTVCGPIILSWAEALEIFDSL